MGGLGLDHVTSWGAFPSAGDALAHGYSPMTGEPGKKCAPPAQMTHVFSELGSCWRSSALLLWL